MPRGATPQRPKKTSASGKRRYKILEQAVTELDLPGSVTGSISTKFPAWRRMCLLSEADGPQWFGVIQVNQVVEVILVDESACGQHRLDGGLVCQVAQLGKEHGPAWLLCIRATDCQPSRLAARGTIRKAAPPGGGEQPMPSEIAPAATRYDSSPRAAPTEGVPGASQDPKLGRNTAHSWPPPKERQHSLSRECRSATVITFVQSC
jgi:hypothetical protein